MTNFSMDLLALQAVNQILHQNVRIWRLMLAAAVGAVFTIVIRLCCHQWMIWEGMVHLLGNPAMLLLAYGKQTLHRFAQEWIWVYLLEVLQGGLEYGFLQNTPLGSHLGALWLCVAIIVGVLPNFFQAYHGREAQILEVQLRQKEKLLTLHAFYDTGNHLRDPFFGKPVQVIEKEVMQQWMGEEELPVRKIPFCAVGTESGLLEAVTVEEMTVHVQGKTQHVSPVIVAIAEQDLFTGKNYQMLLNVETLRV